MSDPLLLTYSYVFGDIAPLTEIVKQLDGLPLRFKADLRRPDYKPASPEELQRYDIILIAVSKNYLDSDVYREIVPFLDMPDGEGPKLLVVPLEPCDWQSTALGRLPVLVRDEEAIKHWQLFRLETDTEAWSAEAKAAAFRGFGRYMNQLSEGLLSVAELFQNEEAAERIRTEWKDRTGVLILSDCGLSHVPFDLLQMPWLKVLVLDNNDIADLVHLENLKSLHSLDLSVNRVVQIEGIENLEQLEHLDLQSNQLDGLEGLDTNTALKILGLSRNRLKVLDGIGHLEKLETLYASNNELEAIDVLAQLLLLRRIVLTNNPIVSLRPLLEHIRSGLPVRVKYSFEPEEPGIFVLHCLRLAEPSPEVIAHGSEAILKYFSDAARAGTRKLELVKLVLVGNSRAGKTQLACFLKGQSQPEDKGSTHLLEISSWEAPFLVSEEGTKTGVHIFDFGGQDYYHDAHRMYYSHDTAYILLWDEGSNKYGLKEEQIAGSGEPVQYEDFPLEYWLESIRYNLGRRSLHNYYGQDPAPQQGPVQIAAPVLVIQNKIDLAEGLLDQSALQSRYPNIRQFFSISLKEQKRTAVLGEVISDYMQALNLSARRLPLYQYQLVEQFRKLAQKPLEIISLATFGERCRKLIRRRDVEFNEKDAAILAEILNNTGIFFYDQHGAPEGLVYTNIRELNERIKGIMDIARKGNDKGIFRESQVEDIAGYREILDLLCRNNSIIPVSGSRYVAPQFLPLQPDEAIAFFLQAFAFTQVRYVYKAYFHKSLLLNLFARYMDKENVDIAEGGYRFFPFWRNGIIIRRTSGTVKEWVLVEFEKDVDAAVGMVSIRTMKPFDRNGLEGEVERSLDELNEGWTVEKQVSVNSSEFFPVDYLQRKVKEKQFVFFKNDRLFSIHDFKPLVSLEQLPKKLFISYSSRNAEFIRPFVTHLEVLRANGDIEPWYDRMIDPGTRWDDTIRREMHSADLVIFLLSPDFLATEYIMKTEIPLAIRQAGRNRAGFFFIQLQECLWERTVLHQFQQTGDRAVVPKNVVTIGRPDNHDKWMVAIRELVKVLQRDGTEAPAQEGSGT